MKKSFSRLILLIFFAAALSSVIPVKAEEVPELIESAKANIDLAVVLYAPLSNVTVYEGYVVPHKVESCFETDGILGEIRVYQGQYVQKGEPVMALDSTSVDQQMNALQQNIEYLRTNGAYEDEIAELNIALIELDVDVLRQNADESALALRMLDLEEASLALRQAKELRQLTLSNYERQLSELNQVKENQVLYAAAEGYVFYDPSLSAGSRIQKQKTYVSICLPDSLYVTVPEYIAERNVRDAECTVLINSESYPITYNKLEQSEYFSRVLSGRTVYTSFTLRLRDEDMKKLNAGQFAAVRIEAQQEEKVLQIPSGAIYSSAGAQYVYVDTENGLERRQIKAGRTNGVMTQILQGLEEGETVYVKD